MKHIDTYSALSPSRTIDSKSRLPINLGSVIVHVNVNYIKHQKNFLQDNRLGPKHYSVVNSPEDYNR